MSKSDSDDQEYYVSIGTPFEIEEDEPLPKPVKISDQVALDKQGRQRFHGAFTGGFSAGYFNTVGSKEGWVPTTFKSSRGDRKESQNIFKPEDFMDEDDFADHGIAPKKLITTDKFRNDDQEIESRKRLLQKAVDEGEIHSAIPGGIIMDDLVIPSKVSIGIKLLQSMGWKLGQGIGEKVPIKLTNDVLNECSKKTYGCMPQTSAHEMDLKTTSKHLAPKDIQSFQFQLKDNVHGIGYSGINPATAMFGAPQTNDQVIFRPTGKEKRGIRGQAFGVGVFEDEDDDIYSNDKISNYDVVMADEEEKTNHGWSGAPKNEVFKGCLPGFIESSVKTSIPKPVKMPDLPPDFKPKHVFQDEGKKSSSSEVKLTSKDRSILLGEMPKPVSQWTLRWDSQPILDENKESKNKEEKKTKFTSRWDKSLLEERPKQIVEFSSESGLCKSDSLFKPFAKFPEKQARYEKFLEAQKSGLQPQLLYDAAATEWERERELSEFARAAILYRPLSSSLLTNRFTRATMVSSDENPKNQDLENGDVMNHKKAAQLGMFGAATRTVLEWRPEQLLCKRFNIPDPYPNIKTKGIPDRIKKKKGFFSDASFEDGLKMIENKISDERQINEEDENIFEVIKSKTVLQKKKFTIGPLSHLNETNDSEPTIFKSTVSEEPLKAPSIDMFKAIFDNSSSESSSEEEEKDKDDVTKISSGEKNVKINQEHKSSNTEQSIHIQTVNISNIVKSESSATPENKTDRPVSGDASQNTTINKIPGEITVKNLNKQPFSLAFLNEDRYKDFKDSKKGCFINPSEVSVKEDSKSRHEYSRSDARKSPESRSRHEYSRSDARKSSESRSRHEYSRSDARKSPESRLRNEYSRSDARKSPESRSGKVSLLKKDDKSNIHLITNCDSSKIEDSKDDWVENERKNSKSKKKKKKKKKKNVKDKKENHSSDSDSDTLNGYISRKNSSKKVKHKKLSLKKEDSVPTSSEIFEKLKSVSSTMKKRASAADFM